MRKTTTPVSSSHTFLLPDADSRSDCPRFAGRKSKFLVATGCGLTAFMASTITAHAVQFLVQCNGKDVANALVVVYTDKESSQPSDQKSNPNTLAARKRSADASKRGLTDAFRHEILDADVTGDKGVSIVIPEGKFKYQVVVYAAGYKLHANEPEYIRDEKITIRLVPELNTRTAERLVLMPVSKYVEGKVDAGKAVPIFFGINEGELIAEPIAWFDGFWMHSGNPRVEFHDGLKRINVSKPFYVYRKGTGEQQRTATCTVVWYYKSKSKDEQKDKMLISVKEK